MESEKRKKIELVTDKETPIVIQDYININTWEKLTFSIDKILVKWNIGNTSAEKLTETLFYEQKSLYLFYVALAKPDTSKLEESYGRATKYYSELHSELLVPEHFPPCDKEKPEISLWFGVNKYLCIELRQQSSLSYIEPELAKEILSALQIALQHNNLQIPVFVLIRDYNRKAYSAYGYFCDTLAYTNFYTHDFNEVHDIYSLYPTFSSLYFKYLPRDLYNVSKKATFKVAARYIYKATYSEYSLQSFFSGNQKEEIIEIYVDKNNYVESDKKAWADFVKSADLVTVKLRVEEPRFEKYKEKLTRCSQVYNKHRKSLSLIVSKILLSDFWKHLNDIKMLQRATYLKMVDDPIEEIIYPKIERLLEKMNPCHISSYYGAMLKKIYCTKNIDYVASIWVTFLAYLRKCWDSDKNFNMLLNDEIRLSTNVPQQKYSIIYRYIKVFPIAEYVTGKLNELREEMNYNEMNSDNKTTSTEDSSIEENKKKDEPKRIVIFILI